MAKTKKTFGTFEDELIARARELQRWMTRRRKLKTLLREANTEIRTLRRFLEAAKRSSQDRRPDVAPDRLRDGAVGHDYREATRVAERLREPDTAMPERPTLFEESIAEALKTEPKLGDNDEQRGEESRMKR